MSLLRELNRLGALRTLDDALARTLQRLDPTTPDEVLAAAALASLAVAQGHAGFDPAQPGQLVDAELPWPEPQVWLQQLAASRFVATPQAPDDAAETAPLALEHGLLYLRRYREYERRLALGLHRIAAQGVEGDIAAIAPLFATLFPSTIRNPASDGAMVPASPPQAGERMPAGQVRGSERSEPVFASSNSQQPPLTPTLSPASGGEGVTTDDRQARAAALALRRALLLVTGGPGTGKTTTIARLLALRVAQAMHAGKPSPRIALAAPTGRAAERMADSLRRATRQMAALGVDAQLLAALPGEASTLHRLLGTLPDSPRFRHHADNPLPFDIVVVDEASMVDLPLMCKLVEAVADGAQLVLLGDADQLPSVEAGDVLAAILAAAGPGDALADEDAEALQPLLGNASDRHSRESGNRSTATLARVHLQRGWRQSDALQLAPLAETVRNGEAAEALALLRGGTLGGVHFHEGVEDPLQARPDLLAQWRELATLADPAQALARANRLRLLTAVREGAQGARGLNARIEAQLSGRRIGAPPAWFPGRLLLVTENSYRHGLFNGDVGICLTDAAGTPLAWFPGADGVRAFHPAALPAHESAFAMTVHKAQGSEFDEVWLQLPRGDSRVLSRELVYTGLTRARSALHIAGSTEVFAASLARHASRVSGLAWRLES